MKGFYISLCTEIESREQSPDPAQIYSSVLMLWWKKDSEGEEDGIRKRETLAGREGKKVTKNDESMLVKDSYSIVIVNLKQWTKNAR